MRYWLDNLLVAFVYHRADRVVAVSNGVRDEIVRVFHADPEKVVTICNPVVPDTQLIEVSSPRHPSSEPFTIVALGRLTRQKGFDILIDAMRYVPQPCRLDIWGDGEERANLERLIAQYGLQTFVHLRGYTRDPYAVVRAADLFVLSSRWEGLPTALVEALACQCQVVATDCPHGPREILLGGRLGQLVRVGQVGELADAIRHAITRDSYVDPSHLLARAQDFTLRAASTQWFRLLGHT